MKDKGYFSERPAQGNGLAQGVHARKIVSAPPLSTEGKPSWWADVLTGRIRRDWASTNAEPRDALWARR